ncbi:hypothetical protein BDZ89DRAFT_1055871 [Hymenopellis radicata]|nr:hypothetical protein BDZ89DRAFT_1055871 [Hymenopellis radicata]
MFTCSHCDNQLRLPVTYACGHSICSAHKLAACPKGCPDQQPPSSGHDVTLTKILAVISEPEDSLLDHLHAESARQKQTRPESPLIHPFPLLDELSCQICYTLLFQPTTTQCQHTFCLPCLQRSLDHAPTCPLCRAPLPAIAPPQPNAVLLNILTTRFPTQYAARTAALAPPARLSTPLFICQLSFPGLPTFLHFFEPRYRLMLRRALEGPHPHFGMVMRDMDYGTMLDIHSVQSLPDGRSMVETVGTFRFRILERGILDSYDVARIERIDDLPVELNPSPPLASLISHCLAFLNHLHHHSSPWVVQRLSNTYGPPPSHSVALERPAEFSFYVAMILPIDEAEKAKLLPVRSVTMRLAMCVWWIEGLRREWWFGQGCIIL